ncbi:hypothetical protein RWE15_17780 [Virgibacillus halophilus]|uniref:Uncharacterized protein n=1 Tax=Tigheibacillus halophilus TaxID=361280 RepID=A0ABU5C9H8_9BACI|nr:hypothetical protein [Virgibacillus halophilus]
MPEKNDIWSKKTKSVKCNSTGIIGRRNIPKATVAAGTTCKKRKIQSCSINEYQ